MLQTLDEKAKVRVSELTLFQPCRFIIPITKKATKPPTGLSLTLKNLPWLHSELYLKTFLTELRTRERVSNGEFSHSSSLGNLFKQDSHHHQNQKSLILEDGTEQRSRVPVFGPFSFYPSPKHLLILISLIQHLRDLCKLEKNNNLTTFQFLII
jgi:hypothetical protein